MACPDSGIITIQDLVNEFGGTAPHTLTEYYRNGDFVPGNNTNVPESGQISLTQFYSAVNEIIHTHSSNATNQNYATIFGSNWASSVPKRIVINSGVTIGGTSGNHAMNIPSGMGGTLIIDNNGSIEGHGGSANGGTGGNAIHCVSTAVTINNNSGASIKAGGGGGGQGGTGGTGGNGGAGGNGGQGRNSNLMCGVITWSSHNCWNSHNGCHQTTCNGGNGNTSSCGNGATHSAWGGLYGYTYGGGLYRVWCYNWNYTTGGSGGAGGSSGGAGGAGGAGGQGQGYNQSATNGSGGSSGSAGGSGSGGGTGGTNAGNGGTGGSRGQGGTGGTGGNGGSFGNSGGNGNQGATGGTGTSGSAGTNGNYTNGASGSSGSGGSSGASGSSGGLAGYYIYNRASITLNNSGTVAGR